MASVPPAVRAACSDTRVDEEDQLVAQWVANNGGLGPCPG